MTSARYCTYCDRDTYPAANGGCSDCGHAMPRHAMTDAQVTAGAMTLLARYGEMSLAGTHDTGGVPILNKSQIRRLEIVARFGRVLGPWNEPDLVKLRTGGLIASEQLHNLTGKSSSSYLWAITDAGRRFLQNERPGA